MNLREIEDLGHPSKKKKKTEHQITPLYIQKNQKSSRE